MNMTEVKFTLELEGTEENLKTVIEMIASYAFEYVGEYDVEYLEDDIQWGD